FDRLESQRFQPIEDVGCFREAKYSWPGDMEGRTILSLALLQQAVDRDAVYLGKTFAMLPERMNEKGFFGQDYAPQCDEQQLSGHGWYLRGLCEYYLDTKDSKTRKMIQDVVDHLVVPTRGKHKLYPIDPDNRDKEQGGYSGTVVSDRGIWRLSSDIGCDFIFMDGVIEAAEVLGRKDLYPIIDEMVDRFLQIDLVTIKAQTHATLTAMRGLIRYAELTGRADLIAESEKRFKLYVTEASTENHMNYNWFGRPTHTEPCAFVDAFMVAVQLWQATGKTKYLEEAHKIYYNGICHAQRANGGFGLEECAGSKDAFLKMQAPEAWWCCTMRGSEGLVRAAEYSYMQTDNTLVLPFFNDAQVRFNRGVIKVQTSYPYEGKVTCQIVKNPVNGTAISFFMPSWSETATIKLNGRRQEVTVQNGFVIFNGRLRAGDMLVYTFDQQPHFAPTHNKNSVAGYQKIYYGPLLLAAEVQKGKEKQLPARVELTWDVQKHHAQIQGSDLVLSPVTDVVDWNYSVDHFCSIIGCSHFREVVFADRKILLPRFLFGALWCTPYFRNKDILLYDCNYLKCKNL
ncbi:MAG: glycoside hydrolase family 127 protein, partial [Chloroflexi bacterium]|nr:glycoside hydrolase family 127 protein [Chloroflexota bacterium]